MVTRRVAIAALAAIGSVASPQSAPPESASELPGAKLQGQGRLTFLGLAIYDLRLWVREGFTAARWDAHELMLELVYSRTLHGHRIAERSLDEMRRQRAIDAPTGARCLEQMRRLFPDVRHGDRIAGMYRPDGTATFFVNGAARGAVRDGDFARLFFGIWLSAQTSEPQLRERLLAGAAP